eukprot:8340150-Pyramimonas_sp.AAC.1
MLAVLMLQTAKCIAVSLVVECTVEVAATHAARIAELVPEWATFTVAGCARHLQIFIGPAAALSQQWREVGQKWWARARAIAMSGHLNARACRCSGI